MGPRFANRLLLPFHGTRGWPAKRSLSFKKLNKQRFCVLDLRNEGLSVMERLCLEECLLRHDTRQWIIWGTHHPIKCRYLQLPELPSYLDSTEPQFSNSNNPCVIVMGIGGKPELLLDVAKVKQDQIWVIKRFSGGGTVVVDQNCLYTTIIGRSAKLKDLPMYPREIMDWTATQMFGPTFAHLKQMATRRDSNQQYPDFSLRENDYVMDETKKVAGNAQSIVKTGFLHHTTFLWSYVPENMTYLTLPQKRPAYRQDRDHDNFLIQLNDAYHKQLDQWNFFDSLENVCHESFEVERCSLEETLSIFENVAGEGGIQAFFDTKSRTRLIDMPTKLDTSHCQ